MKINKKVLLPVCIVLALAIIATGVTLALLKRTSNTVDNKFYAGDVGCEIHEDITSEKGVKKDVKLYNSGSVAAYMRACVAVSWIDESGNYCNKAPVEGVDYTVDIPDEWKWVKSTDGTIYYCISVVNSKSETPVLFESIKPVAENTPDGYNLSVEILGSAIQPLPVESVESEWGITIDKDGNITVE